MDKRRIEIIQHAPEDAELIYVGKKAGELLAIILGEVLVAGLCIPRFIVSGISAYITFMEVVSIMENFHKLGIPIPSAIAKALSTMDETLNGKKSEDELSTETKNKIKKSIKNKKGGNKNAP